MPVVDHVSSMVRIGDREQAGDHLRTTVDPRLLAVAVDPRAGHQPVGVVAARHVGGPAVEAVAAGHRLGPPAERVQRPGQHRSGSGRRPPRTRRGRGTSRTAGRCRGSRPASRPSRRTSDMARNTCTLSGIVRPNPPRSVGIRTRSKPDSWNASTTSGTRYPARSDSSASLAASAPTSSTRASACLEPPSHGVTVLGRAIANCARCGKLHPPWPVTSLSSAVAEAAGRDPVVAELVALAGPLRHVPRDPDGPFGFAGAGDRLPAARRRRGDGHPRPGPRHRAGRADPGGPRRRPRRRAARRRAVGSQAGVAARPRRQGHRRHRRADGHVAPRRTPRSSSASRRCAASAGGRPRCS